MKKHLLLVLVLIMSVLGLKAQNNCNPPTGLNATLHIPSWNNVSLNWNAVVDTTAIDLMWSTRTLSSSLGSSAGPINFTGIVRFEPADMVDANGLTLNSVTFYPSADPNICTYSIYVWQGGSILMSATDTVYDRGTLMTQYDIPANLIHVGALNTIILDSAVAVDNTQELWIGVKAVTTTPEACYPFGCSANTGVTGKGDILLDEDSTFLFFNDLSADLAAFNWIIIGTLSDPSNAVSGYNLYCNNNLVTPDALTSCSYVDSVAAGFYEYQVTAVYANGCESDPISTTATMTDYPCLNCLDSVIVGTGTTAQYELPLNTYYNYSYSQQIYEANELGNITGGIPCISFQYIHNTAQSKNIKVYMGNTTKNTFDSGSDWIPTSEMTLVYNGAVNFQANSNDNWVNVPLSIPFEWDGNSNVVVAVVNNTGSYLNSDNTFMTNTASAKALIASRDASPFNENNPESGSVKSIRPNIRFMVGEPITCPTPSHLITSNITSESVDVSWWSRGNDSGYEIVLVPEGSSLFSETAVFITDTFYSFSNLTENSNYTIYLHATCTDENSSWIQTEFHTTCLPINELPYREDFSSVTPGVSSYPNCWYRIANEEFPYVATTSSTGVGSLYLASSTYQDCFAILHPMDETIEMNTLRIRFKAMKTATAYGHLEIGIMTDPTDASTFTVLKSIDGTDYEASNSWCDFFASFQNYTGNGKYIAFRSPSDYYSYTYVDDIDVDYISGCTTPSRLRVSNEAGTSALISWTASEYAGDGDIYNIEYAEQGTENWQTITTSNTSEYLLAGLEPMTYYTVKLYVTCDNGSSDTLTVNFNTICLSGGEITIGNGNENNTNLPSYSFYNYGYSQQLFLASEFNGASDLTSISFYANNIAQQRKLRFYLMPTTATNLSTAWIPVSNAQLVYAGNQNLTTGWNTFHFNAPFSYDGTSNLVLITIDSTGSYVSGNSWRVTSTATTLSRYVYQDASPYSITSVPSASGSAVALRNNIIFGGECDSLVSCIAPSLFVNEITNNSANLFWAPGYQESAWEMDYHTDLDTTWVSLGTQSSTSYLMNNLTAATTYTVRLRSDCYGEYSDYTMVTFTTECDYINNLPFTENFDSYANTVYPDCWNRLSTYTNTLYPYISNTYAASGTNSLYFYNGGSNYYTIGTTPRFDDQIAMDSLIIAFSTYFQSEDYFIEVGIMENPSDASTFTSLQTVRPNSYSTWEDQEVITRNYTGNGHYVAFRLPIGASSYSYIDNINIDFIPSCPHITNLTVANIDSSSATLNWTAGGSESEWEIVVLPTAQSTNVDFDTCTAYIVNSESYEITDLNASTFYTAFVRANCDGGDNSPWMSISFQTTQIPGQLPYEEDFESAQNWGFANGSLTNQWYIGTATSNGGTHALYISSDNGTTNSYNNTSTAYVWAFRDIYFPASNYGYQMSFDWKAYGESGYDYMKVFIGEPVTPTAGTTQFNLNNVTTLAPGVNTSYSEYFNMQSTFTNYSITLPAYTTDGVRRIYFMWHNDGSAGTTPPAAVDNIYIANITCPTPTNVNVANITTNSAEVSWTENGSASNWTVQYKVSTDANWTELQNAINPTLLTSLQAGTSYFVRVLADCDNGEFSPASAPANFATIATCPAPSNLHSTAQTTSSVDLDWTPGGTETSWTIIYGPTGFSVPNGTTVNATTHPYSVTGLSDETTYDFYVKADCGGGDESTVVGPISIRPGAILMPVSGSQTITTCGGTIFDDGGATDPYSNSCSGILTINPETAGMAIQLTGTYNTETNYDKLYIYDGASTSGNLINTYEGSGSINVRGTVGALTLQFVSDGSVNNPGFELAVSCVPLETPTECPAPTNLRVDAQTSNSATLAWDQEAGTATTWTLNYKLASASTWTSITVQNNPYTISDLTVDATYQAQVIANCADGTQSNASNPVTFTITGINDYMMTNGISLTPNPATNYVDISVTDNNVSIQEINIYDVYGKLLKRVTAESNPTHIDISDLASGMYMVHIIGDNGVANKSFIKK